MWAQRLALLGLLLGCEDTLDTPDAPVVVDVRPDAARPGTVVTLVGENFGLRGARDRVWLGGVPVEVTAWGNTSLAVRIPADNGPGVFDFVVRTDAQVSRPFAFEVLADVGTIAP